MLFANSHFPVGRFLQAAMGSPVAAAPRTQPSWREGLQASSGVSNWLFLCKAGAKFLVPFAMWHFPPLLTEHGHFGWVLGVAKTQVSLARCAAGKPIKGLLGTAAATGSMA